MKLMCKWMAALAALAVMLMTGACSSSPSPDEVLETVPDDAVNVTRIDLKKIFDNAGIREDDGKYVMSDDLETLFGQLPSSARDRFEQALAALPGIDAENLFFWVTPKEELAFTVGLKHASEVSDALKKEYGAPVKEDGFEVYEMERDVIIAIRDNQLWVTDKLSHLTRALNRADEAPYTANIGPSQYLLGERAVTSVLSIPALAKASGSEIPEPLRDYRNDFVCMSADLKGPALTAQTTLMNKDGKSTFPGDFFGEIDMSALRYVPGNAAIVAALGRPARELIDMMYNEGGMRRGDKASEMLDAVDGTSLFALIPPSSATRIADHKSWNYVMLTHMDQEHVNSMCGEICSTTGVAENATSHYSFTHPYRPFSAVGGQTVNWGNYDGYFVASSLPVSGGQNNSLTTAFEGKRGVLWAALGADNALVKELGLPFGLEFRATYDADCLNGLLRLTGSEQNFLEALIHLAADSKWQREVTGALMGMTGSGYYDDAATEVVEEYEVYDEAFEPDYYGEEVVEEAW